MKTQNILLSLLALLGAFFVVAGCAFSGASGLAENPPPSSTVPPPKPVLVKVSEELVLINNQLALDLYQSLQQTDNVFFSPYSLTRSFAMLYPGARAETAQALDEYFGFSGLGATLPQEMQNLDATLMSRSFEKDGPNTFPQLTFAQALWIQEGMALNPDYQELLQTYFGVPVSFADFAQEPDHAREAVQQWVSEQSAGLLQNSLPAEIVRTDTKMILANAVYFNAAWRFPFDKEIEGKFHSLEGTVWPTQMITKLGGVQYARGENFQAIELPYSNRQLAMMIIVPDEGAFETVENQLTLFLIQEISATFKVHSMNLTLPIFQFQADLPLKNLFMDNGLDILFDATRADFSGITSSVSLVLDEIIHKTSIRVDASGTEAAGMTLNAWIEVEGPPPAEFDLLIDRPFIFLIRDLPTQTFLFVGRLMNPTP